MKWGGVFCKKMDLTPQNETQQSNFVFYFTFYLFGGAYAPNVPPPAYRKRNVSLSVTRLRSANVTKRIKFLLGEQTTGDPNNTVPDRDSLLLPNSERRKVG